MLLIPRTVCRIHVSALNKHSRKLMTYSVKHLNFSIILHKKKLLKKNGYSRKIAKNKEKARCIGNQSIDYQSMNQTRNLT